MQHDSHLYDSLMNFCCWWQVAEQVGKVEGVSKVLLAENDVFKGLLPGELMIFIAFALQLMIQINKHSVMYIEKNYQ